MNFSKNYDALLKQMAFKKGKRVTHYINKNSPILPFPSRKPDRVKFINGFNGILGEFVRIELEKSWNDD